MREGEMEIGVYGYQAATAKEPLRGRQPKGAANNPVIGQNKKCSELNKTDTAQDHVNLIKEK